MHSVLKNFILALFLVFLLGACETSDDNNPSPIPDVRDKFIGTWNVSETCSKGNYNASISKDPTNTAQVLLSNFADSRASQPDTGIVTSGRVVVYAQENSEDWYIEGSGSYNENGSITWNYTLLISGNAEDCTATYTRNK